jgi:cytochrome c-type biogenesis protein
MTQQDLPTPKKSAIPAMTAQRRWTTFVQGVWFVAGFATFVIGVMGLASTVLGNVLQDNRVWFNRIGGVMLILFGLFTLKVINIPILYSDTRRGMSNVSKGANAVQSYLTGLGFAAGWTPCIGPFLGAILTLAANSGNSLHTVSLLSAYTLGLGIPFLMVAALADRMTPVLNKLKRNMRTIEIISGVLLIGIGTALLFGQLTALSQIFSASGDTGIESLLPDTLTENLSIPVAALAGLLSFTSPCVLPLVPAYLGFIGGWAVNNARSEA